jgi:curved DNA-binding protein CbpA
MCSLTLQCHQEPEEKKLDGPTRADFHKKYAQSALNNSIRPTTEFETWYEVIGVDEVASASLIKRTYVKRALKLHPDRARLNPEKPLDDEKHTKWDLINQAYHVLSDQELRDTYNDEMPLRKALFTFYAVHNPIIILDNIERTIKAWTGREDTLFQNLSRKYDANPGEIIEQYDTLSRDYAERKAGIGQGDEFEDDEFDLGMLLLTEEANADLQLIQQSVNLSVNSSPAESEGMDAAEYASTIDITAEDLTSYYYAWRDKLNALRSMHAGRQAVVSISQRSTEDFGQLVKDLSEAYNREASAVSFQERADSVSICCT